MGGGEFFGEAPGGEDVKDGHGDIRHDEFYAESGEVVKEEGVVEVVEDVFFGDEGVGLDVFHDRFVAPRADMVDNDEIFDYAD